MLNFHHVNLGVPLGGAEAEASFLVEVLGYRRLEAPPEAPTARWFEGEDGKQIHLSEDADHRPAERAHVAIEVGSDLDGLRQRLSERGVSFDYREGVVTSTVNCRDPAGNLWELRLAPASAVSSA